MYIAILTSVSRRYYIKEGRRRVISEPTDFARSHDLAANSAKVYRRQKWLHRREVEGRSNKPESTKERCKKLEEPGGCCLSLE